MPATNTIATPSSLVEQLREAVLCERTVGQFYLRGNPNLISGPIVAADDELVTLVCGASSPSTATLRIEEIAAFLPVKVNI